MISAAAGLEGILVAGLQRRRWRFWRWRSIRGWVKCGKYLFHTYAKTKGE